MAFLPEGYLNALAKNPGEDWLIVHEMAHQLWGNLVTCATWGDFWLNEAVVVWWVARDKTLRGEPEGYQRELELWGQRVERALAQGHDPRIARPQVSVKDAGGSIVYHAGALLIHEVATRQPDAATFDAILHRWMRLALAQDGLSLTTDAFIDALQLDEAARARVMEGLAGKGR